MIYNNWIFGANAGIDFTGTAQPVLAGGFDQYEGCSCISDSTGNLLLYSDGIKVWDGNGVVRATGLLGSTSSTQSALIVPDPATPDRYYIFTSDGVSGGNNHVNGIRLTLGSWVATPLPSLMTMPPTAPFSATERLTAVRHKNGKDFWVLTIVQAGQPSDIGSGPAILRRFKVTSAGVSFAGDQPLNIQAGDIGHLKASKNGARIALADFWSGHVFVFNFSNATGLAQLASKRDIPILVPPFNTGGKPYGLEFSANGRLLYYSTLFPLPTSASPVSDGHVFQVLLPSGAPLHIGTHANDKDGDFALGALQLGPDHMIYVAQDGEKQLGVIANPDIPGSGCNLSFSAFPLATASTCHAGLPNMIRDLY